MKKEAKEYPLFRLSSLTIFILFLVLSLVFFYLISLNVSGRAFGFVEIIIALVFAIVSTILLSISTMIMKKNLYTGLACSLASLIIGLGALFTRYKGTHTTMFALAGSLITLVYMGIYAFKFRKS